MFGKTPLWMAYKVRRERLVTLTLLLLLFGSFVSLYDRRP
jgi:hypothetical protein